MEILPINVHFVNWNCSLMRSPMYAIEDNAVRLHVWCYTNGHFVQWKSNCFGTEYGTTWNKTPETCRCCRFWIAIHMFIYLMVWLTTPLYTYAGLLHWCKALALVFSHSGIYSRLKWLSHWIWTNYQMGECVIARTLVYFTVYLMPAIDSTVRRYSIFYIDWNYYDTITEKPRSNMSWGSTKFGILRIKRVVTVYIYWHFSRDSLLLVNQCNFNMQNILTFEKSASSRIWYQLVFTFWGFFKLNSKKALSRFSEWH